MVARVLRKIWGVFGVVVVLASVTMLTLAIGDLVTGEGRSTRSTLVGLVVFFIGTGLAGVYIVRSTFGWPRLGLPVLQRRSRADKEKAILAYAASVGGRVTLAEVALQCTLSVEESQEILDALAARHAAELLVTDEGVVVYDFDILSAKEKEQAREL